MFFLSLDLYNATKKLSGGWWVVELDYNVSSGPFLSLTLEIEIGDGPGPELDNISDNKLIKCVNN